tara:strand:+ start:10013 stop:10756 length:744 start_codon:yes stop_codon:yes gene_type:complete
MKVALWFSGKLGNWKGCSMSIMENIIRPLRPDIFVTTWDDQPSYDFCQYYKPAKHQTLNFKETMKLLRPTSKLPCQPSKGLIPMLAGIKASNTIFENYASLRKINYDLVIRLRPDMQVLEQIKTHEIKDCLKNKHIRLPLFESDNVYDHKKEMKNEFSFSFVHEKASLPNQVNDQLAIGSPEQMSKYANCLYSLSASIQIMWDSGYPEYMIKVPESVITMCLNLQQCKYKRLSGSSPFGNIKTKLIK